LREETGVDLVAADLGSPDSHGSGSAPNAGWNAAVYTAAAVPVGGFTPNGEISAICWWDQAQPPQGGCSVSGASTC
jgi:hypothetical protein